MHGGCADWCLLDRAEDGKSKCLWGSEAKLRELERMDCLPILNGVAHKSRLYRRPASHVEASVTAFLAFSVPPILRMA